MVVAHIFNSSIQWAEAGRSFEPGLQSEFQDIQGCTQKPWLKKKSKQASKKRQTLKQTDAKNCKSFKILLIPYKYVIIFEYTFTKGWSLLKLQQKLLMKIIIFKSPTS